MASYEDDNELMKSSAFTLIVLTFNSVQKGCTAGQATLDIKSGCSCIKPRCLKQCLLHNALQPNPNMPKLT